MKQPFVCRTLILTAAAAMTAMTLAGCGGTAKDQFYIFDNITSGYTQGAPKGIGLPFECKQEDGSVAFTFASSEEPAEVLIVTSSENGTIKGHFADHKELVFELLTDVDVDGFDSLTYTDNAEE
ncbi:MAG: hypothetical protein IJT32_05285 [Lachnospiraceae bacterium]|nr:hypothetical protein [Lachnospiraceae bacterium]